MIHLSQVPAFGWESSDCNANRIFRDYDNNGHIFRNGLKCIGYIPGVSILVGIFRAVISSISNDSNKKLHLLRAATEIFCVSFLLMGVDLIVTIHRRNKHNLSTILA